MLFSESQCFCISPDKMCLNENKFYFSLIRDQAPKTLWWFLLGLHCLVITDQTLIMSTVVQIKVRMFKIHKHLIFLHQNTKNILRKWNFEEENTEKVNHKNWNRTKSPYLSCYFCYLQFYLLSFTILFCKSDIATLLYVVISAIICFIVLYLIIFTTIVEEK